MNVNCYPRDRGFLPDPVVRQTSLEGAATLAQNKPLVLGSIDIPESSRHEEIEVTSELVR